MKVAGENWYKVHLYNDISEQTKGLNIVNPYYTNRYEDTFHAICQHIDVWIKHFKKPGISY